MPTVPVPQFPEARKELSSGKIVLFLAQWDSSPADGRRTRTRNRACCCYYFRSEPEARKWWDSHKRDFRPITPIEFYREALTETGYDQPDTDGTARPTYSRAVLVGPRGARFQVS